MLYFSLFLKTSSLFLILIFVHKKHYRISIIFSCCAWVKSPLFHFRNDFLMLYFMSIEKAVWKNGERPDLRGKKMIWFMIFRHIILWLSTWKRCMCFLMFILFTALMFILNILFMMISKNINDIKSFKDLYLYILLIW